MNEPNWTTDGESILAPDTLDKIRHHLENVGYLVVMHKHWCSGCAPSALGFDDFDKFTEYLDAEAKPGDKILIWPWPDGKPMFEKKYPNDKGQFPVGGAY